MPCGICGLPSKDGLPHADCLLPDEDDMPVSPRAETRVAELEAALKDAIEFADEGWAYASPYFVEKWDYKGQREKLCVALKGKNLDD